MPEIEKPDKAYTLRSGEWYVMAEMTGRDYLLIRELQNTAVNDDKVRKLLDMIEKRCTASSVPDPIDRPFGELMELIGRWYTGVEDAALPPETATP